MATKDISVIRDKKTGDIKDIRDKKLADGTEQTTLSQSGTVQGWDANGNAIFIPRDSVLQILSEVINSNNQSTIGSLFGMGANNTPASINMANLASVLSAGVLSHLFIRTQDPDVCYDLGFYSKQGGSYNPMNYGVFITIPYRKAFGNSKPDSASQIFFPSGDSYGHENEAFYRNSTTDSWNAWQKIKVG